MSEREWLPFSSGVQAFLGGPLDGQRRVVSLPVEVVVIFSGGAILLSSEPAEVVEHRYRWDGFQKAMAYQGWRKAG